MNDIAKVIEDPQFGGSIEFKDREAADEFDDFVSEEHYILYNTKFEGDKVTFYFGEVSSTSKLEILLREFFEKYGE